MDKLRLRDVKYLSGSAEMRDLNPHSLTPDHGLLHCQSVAVKDRRLAIVLTLLEKNPKYGDHFYDVTINYLHLIKYEFYTWDCRRTRHVSLSFFFLNWKKKAESFVIYIFFSVFFKGYVNFEELFLFLLAEVMGQI